MQQHVYWPLVQSHYSESPYMEKHRRSFRKGDTEHTYKTCSLAVAATSRHLGSIIQLIACTLSQPVPLHPTHTAE